jgi:hypothetical protein
MPTSPSTTSSPTVPVTTNIYERVMKLTNPDGSSGTAFTLEVDGRQYLITAAHVVPGDRPVSVRLEVRAQVWERELEHLPGVTGNDTTTTDERVAASTWRRRHSRKGRHWRGNCATRRAAKASDLGRCRTSNILRHRRAVRGAERTACRGGRCAGGAFGGGRAERHRSRLRSVARGGPVDAVPPLRGRVGRPRGRPGRVTADRGYVV